MSFLILTEDNRLKKDFILKAHFIFIYFFKS